MFSRHADWLSLSESLRIRYQPEAMRIGIYRAKVNKVRGGEVTATVREMFAPHRISLLPWLPMIFWSLRRCRLK
jgi:hypothetical protein